MEEGKLEQEEEEEEWHSSFEMKDEEKICPSPGENQGENQGENLTRALVLLSLFTYIFFNHFFPKKPNSKTKKEKPAEAKAY